MIDEKKLEECKRKYAHLIVVVGLNDVKGKVCRVCADLDQPDFVKLVVDELYQRGARRVDMFWTYRPVLKTIYKYTDKHELCKIYKPDIERWKFDLQEYSPLIVLESWDPFWMDGVDAEKVASMKAARARASHPYSEKMDAVETPWCLAAVPSVQWAKRLFPKDSDNVALNKMWEKTFEAVRVLHGDPIRNWEKFNKEIKARARWLDSLEIKTLHYTSKNGTDLIVGINPHAHFVGGAHDSIGNPPYNPNMPAVECFTTPDRLVTEGIVYSTKPLSRCGHLMEDFSLRFHHGKIVEVKAKKGGDMLKKLIATDQYSCYLGEVALVPYDSPVNNTNMIYYNTLFDENAACHFAFGYSLITTYNRDVRKLSDNELVKLGLNRGSIHIDFMVGNRDLNIIATTRSGKKVQIFKNGNWAVKL